MLLNCHTSFSYRYGTFSVEGLLRSAQQQGYETLAITDINNTSAWIDACRLAGEMGIKPVLGIDFRNGISQQYVALAAQPQGFHELNAHLSAHLQQQMPFEEIAPGFNYCFVIYPLARYKGWPLRENEFIGINPQELARLPFSIYRHRQDKMVILQTVSFADKTHYNTHRLLRAIDQNTLLSKLDQSQQAQPDHVLLTKHKLETHFMSYEQVRTNTQRILDSCNAGFEIDKLANKNLRYYTGTFDGDIEKLKVECESKLHYRYGNKISTDVTDRLEKELRIIAQMQFASYFLVNWDIVSYAKRKGYFHVGRGSGANSIVAYLLGITDVDPIKLQLYFERFINPYRSNAPDFDIDFSWLDRDDITRYIFERFNKNNNVALMGSYNTFQSDATIRQLGKVFGLPSAEIDRLQKTPYDMADKMGQLILRYSKRIEGLPSHLSIHASGIVISEESLYNYTSLEIPPKGYPTTQFSMLEAEDIGLYKFDILSQRGLGKIKDSLSIISKNHKRVIDIHQVDTFFEDEKVKSLLRVGNTIGCFYVESPAMRMLLAKLQADDYLRLVAASSIIRPGVAQSGMMREYIQRYRNPHLRDKAKEDIPEMYALLEETYGVMVYQEDVIKIAHFFAGLSLAEADNLRRGMSWKYKYRKDFQHVKDRFFENCRKKETLSEQTIANIWMQIESFANFAFSKGHSASYAVESYQALYLKAYYPLEYMVATLNNGGGFYRTELYLHEARQKGATIKPPCVNHSDALCTIKGQTIYLGLAMIKELGEDTIKEIVEERKKNGNFASLRQFTRRVPASIEQLRLLIRVGGFDFTQRNRKELLWEAHACVNPIKQNKAPLLFEPEEKVWELPELFETPLDNAFDEMELLGFPLCSPFSLLRDPISTQNTMKDLAAYVGKSVEIVGYMINIKTTFTTKGERMHFGTFIDLDGKWIDTVHFPPVSRAFPFTGPGCYHIKGKLTKEYDFMSIEVEEMNRLPVVNMESVRFKPASKEIDDQGRYAARYKTRLLGA